MFYKRIILGLILQALVSMNSEAIMRLNLNDPQSVEAVLKEALKSLI
jgi:hypothetical protein